MTKKALHVCGALAAALVLILGDPVSAAVTGKIAGRVTDSQTGEPLVGAAVVIQGTNIGTSTDADGRYFLINILPGSYTLEASLIGYRSVAVEDVRVNANRTVTVDFALEASPIAVEAVTVVAEREVIKLDVSGSESILQAEDFAAVPVKSVQEALALEPGITAQGNIRGGSLDQTQVVVDGHLYVDERLNEPIMQINSTVLEEVQILAGGFNAEYGNARSGVINVVSRSAIGQPIWSSLSAQYYPAQKKFREPDYPAFGENSFEWQTYGSEASLTTPLVISEPDPMDPNKTVQDTVFYGWVEEARRAGWTADPQGAAQAMRDRWRWQHRVTEYANKPDYVIDGALGIPISPMFGVVLSGRKEYTAYATPQYRPAYEDLTLQARINIRPIQAMRFDVDVLYGHSSGLSVGLTDPYTEGAIQGATSRRGMGYTIARDFRPSINFMNPVNKYALYGNPQQDNYRYLIGASMAYTIDERSFIEVGFEYRNFSYEVGPGTKDEYVEVARVWTGDWNGDGVTDSLIASSLPYGYSGTSLDDGTWLKYQLSNLGSSRDSSNWSGVSFRASYTNQINARNQIKVGLEGTFNSIHQYGGRVAKQAFHMQEFSASPIRMAAYAQDKIEYEGMIANVGLRMDYFNSRGRFYEPDEPYSRIFDRGVWGELLGDPELKGGEGKYDVGKSMEKIWGGTDSLDWRDATGKVHFSPRLGISHPISRTTKVFFNYGHFYSVPVTRLLYGLFPNQPGDIEYQGNPELDMPRTIAYELGLDQEIAGQYLLHIAGYYKDAINEIGQVRWWNLEKRHEVYRPYNKTYADIRGFELKFSKRVGRFVTGFFNSGLEIVTRTKLGYAEVWEDPNIPPMEEIQTETGRAQPYFTLNVDLHTPRDHSAFGLPPVASGGWSLSWLTEYRRGAEVVYDPVGNYVTAPNVPTQDYWMSDMRLTKAFTLGKVNLSVFLDVLNVFDRKVWQGGMRSDDYQAYLRSLHFPVDDPVIETDPGDDKIGDTPDYAVLPERDTWALWKYPRTIAFGLRMDF